MRLCEICGRYPAVKGGSHCRYHGGYAPRRRRETSVMAILDRRRQLMRAFEADHSAAEVEAYRRGWDECLRLVTRDLKAIREGVDSER